jgi:hypothetical protein
MWVTSLIGDTERLKTQGLQDQEEYTARSGTMPRGKGLVRLLNLLTGHRLTVGISEKCPGSRCVIGSHPGTT